MKTALVLTAATAILSAGFATDAPADSVKLHGATTVVNVVVTPNRAAVEKSTGHTLEIVGNATGKGLVDLSEGKADAAMVSEPLDMRWPPPRRPARRSIPRRCSSTRSERRDRVRRSLCQPREQADLGADPGHPHRQGHQLEPGGRQGLPITVYSDAVSGGTRAMVKKVVLGGTEYAESVKSQTNVSRVADVVAKDESGFGAIGKGFVDPAKRRSSRPTSRAAPRLVTVGEPSPKVKQVVEAFRAASK